MPQTARLVTLGLLSALTIATLTGCAGAPQAQATLKPAEADRMYVTLMHAQLSDIVATDAYLIDAGKSVCKALRIGTSIEQLAAAYEDKGIPSDTAGALFAAAPASYCPERSKAVQKWLDAN